jgi:hypothetical protein
LARDVTRLRRRLFAVGAFVLIARLAGAAEFSADIPGARAKLFTADGKVRIETAAGYFLIDSSTSVFVHPNQKLFTDARHSRQLVQLFIPVDPGNPCVQWQAAAAGEWRCEKIEAGRWRVSPPGQAARECWIDSSLGFPTRIQTSAGETLALENIRIAAQSPDLFTLPATYRKLDPQTLIERMKHSDVWVETPASN